MPLSFLASTPTRLGHRLAKQWPAYAVAGALLALDAVRVLSNPDDHSGLFGGLTMVLHEGGHLLWAFPGSEWLAVAGGSATQVLAPVVAASLLARQGDRAGATLMGFWLATSLASMSVYVADASDQLLPLISTGGDGLPIHDWTYLLGHADLLPRDTAIARLVHLIAWCAFGITLVASAAQIASLRERSRAADISSSDVPRMAT